MIKEDHLVYKTVMLAGLLHDVGKFLQKGSFGDLDISGKPSEVSARFVRTFQDSFAAVCDFELLENLLLKHHECPDYPGSLQVDRAPEEVKALAQLVSLADSYSSSESGKTGSDDQDNPTRPLEAVFCRLEIGKKPPPLLTYRAKVYGVENTFPAETGPNSKQDLSYLLQEFGREFSELAKRGPNFEKLYTGLHSLFLKYAWCIPSNSREDVADVSLFDHLKTTSAIASCLYLYHVDRGEMTAEAIKKDDEDKFLLATGDISGIQDYIFSGISIGAGGMARKLRARSFMINMISELAAHTIVKRMNLPVANIIMSSGGKFYVLLPNSSRAGEIVRQLQVDTDRWLLDEYQGELALNLACYPFSGRSFYTFGTVTEAVNRRLVDKKQQPFADTLREEEKWLEDKFVHDVHDERGLGICRGCGREFAVEDADGIFYGRRCLQELELGRKIPRTRFLQFTEAKTDISLAGELGMAMKVSEDQLSEDGLAFALNEINLPAGVAVLPREVANHVPVEKGRVITFEEIADRSRGVKKLGLLKADVDNLGQLFAFGLRRDLASLDSISRMTTLSRMLDHFFSGHVNKMLQEDYPSCYTVYSGGDDLVIIGPWDQVIELASALQERFSRFTGQNANITLSAGIAFARPRTPVIKTVENAENLLEQAKEQPNPKTGKSRNQACMFGKTMSWAGFMAAKTEGKRLAGWVTQNKLSSSELWKLKKYDLMYRDYLEEHKVSGLLYKAFLAYQIGRMKKGRGADLGVLKWHEDLLSAADGRMENLGVAVDYAFSITRKGD